MTTEEMEDAVDGAYSRVLATRLSHFIKMYDPKSSWQRTIVPSRYGGTYEGGAWLAFPWGPWVVAQLEDAQLEDWDGGDGGCLSFWKTVNDLGWPIGRGPDPNGAKADLDHQLEVWGGDE